jgi:hypothetical protein
MNSTRFADNGVNRGLDAVFLGHIRDRRKETTWKTLGNDMELIAGLSYID